MSNIFLRKPAYLLLELFNKKSLTMRQMTRGLDQERAYLGGQAKIMIEAGIVKRKLIGKKRYIYSLTKKGNSIGNNLSLVNGLLQ